MGKSKHLASTDVIRTEAPQRWGNQMSRIVRKLDFRQCENKGADQLRSNCEADQRPCFHYTDSTIPPLLKSEISSFWPSSFFDLVGNPEDRFSHVAAQMVVGNTNRNEVNFVSLLCSYLLAYTWKTVTQFYSKYDGPIKIC